MVLLEGSSGFALVYDDYAQGKPDLVVLKGGFGLTPGVFVEGCCCFTGRRAVKLPWRYDERDPRCLDLKRRIRDAVDAAYYSGTRHFICGMANGCDMYFGEIVAELKREHEDVTLEAAIPCLTQDRGWPRDIRRRYAELMDSCDYRTVVSNEYTRGCMQRRNVYMVDCSRLLIAAYDGEPSGGTASTLAYAVRMEKQIVRLDI